MEGKKIQDYMNDIDEEFLQSERLITKNGLNNLSKKFLSSLLKTINIFIINPNIAVIPAAIISIIQEFTVTNCLIVVPTNTRTITLVTEDNTSGKKVFHFKPIYLAVKGTVYIILRAKLTKELTPAIANTPKLVVFINIKTIMVLINPDSNTNREFIFNLFTTVKIVYKH